MKAIILGAGIGRRMNAKVPKWYLSLLDRPFIDYLAQTLNNLKIPFEVCIKEEMKRYMKYPYYFQKNEYYESFGPLANITNFNDDYLIINGDMPLVKESDIEQFINYFYLKQKEIGILVAKNVSNKDNYQKVKVKNYLILNKGNDYNLGVYIIKGSVLKKHLEKFKNIPSLTLPEFLALTLEKTYLHEIPFSKEYLNINTKDDLIELNNYLKNKVLEDVKKHNIVLGNITVDYFSKLKGNTIKDGSIINNTTIFNSLINENTKLTNVNAGYNNELGPFLKIEDAVLQNENTIGSFVEVKRSEIGNANKIKHHAYLGDIKIGDNNNFGAFFVTANFNGRIKQKSIVGSNNFIGSHNVLVSPIMIGSNNFLGAFLKVTENITDNRFITFKFENQNLENTFKDS